MSTAAANNDAAPSLLLAPPACAERGKEKEEVRLTPPNLRAGARVCVDGKLFARAGKQLRIRGVTYGPFAPDADGQPFPAPERARDDLIGMQAAGINAFRTYHVPPSWLLDLADEQGLSIFVDIPWRKHLCFLDGGGIGYADGAVARREARRAVTEAAGHCRAHPCLLAYSIGNEIPADIVRWHGAGRVERFLAELVDTARQADPQGLVTYANFPPTEYLDLSFLDFVTFNVYLHDREAFRRYLFRLQNCVGDRPLLLGELGMDTFRHGELEQADFLAGHLQEAQLMGLAGAFVFSWTDDWHTGGHPIEDWAFGITHRDRSPKASYHALREEHEKPLTSLLPQTPRVSVVVCTYNGGRTLEQCLRSLQVVDYPDYEVIVVDDGSADDTRAILSRFVSASPSCLSEGGEGKVRGSIRVIHQTNQGLSTARNVGLREADGAIIAYTDSDCFADPSWLTHLVYQLQRSGAAAVGGPNLTPDDGWLAACVAASPGQPTHVLESDQVAEHIPGCNMAFRREALLAINGFDPQYRKAGDDVDVCWRLQQAGYWITFAPGAFVWHHRRQGPRSYLRQQAGYGEAEALLSFQHPDRFNGRGEGKWRGMLYGASLRGLRLGGPIIYRGTFGCGLFQCLYQPGPAHWAMLPSTLEWHLVAVLAALAGLLWPPAWVGAGAMLGLSLLVAVLQAAQARLAPKYAGLRSRAVVAALCFAQPLVRSWKRYRTRMFAPRVPAVQGPPGERPPPPLPLGGRLTVEYWSEAWHERTQLLGEVVAVLTEQRWARVLDSGWSDWDLQVYCQAWTLARICTVQEDHGGGKRLIRVRFQMLPRASARLVLAAGLAGAGVLTCIHAVAGAATAAVVLAAVAAAWRHGATRAARLVGVFSRAATKIGLFPVGQARSLSEKGEG